VRGEWFCERGSNRGEHRLCRKQRIIVPKSQNAKTELFQYGSARSIVLALVEVLPTIDFHDQAAVDTYEIDDVACDLMLTAEFASQLRTAQLGPEPFLRVRRGFS